jgi:hypothetical protein
MEVCFRDTYLTSSSTQGGDHDKVIEVKFAKNKLQQMNIVMNCSGAINLASSIEHAAQLRWWDSRSIRSEGVAIPFTWKQAATQGWSECTQLLQKSRLHAGTEIDTRDPVTGPSPNCQCRTGQLSFAPTRWQWLW